MALPWNCHGIAMEIPWNCHGIAMAMPWHCLRMAMALPWHCHGIAMALSWNCHGMANSLKTDNIDHVINPGLPFYLDDYLDKNGYPGHLFYGIVHQGYIV